jgi:hypothetical protein
MICRLADMEFAFTYEPDGFAVSIQPAHNKPLPNAYPIFSIPMLNGRID